MNAKVIFKNLPHDVNAIKQQLDNFLQGQPVNEDIIRNDVLSSWIRSKSAKVDPFNSFGKIISDKDAEQLKLGHDDLLKAFGTVSTIIEEIVSKHNLRLQLFDNMARSVNVGLFIKQGENVDHNDYASRLLNNLSENIIGTNAVCLALNGNKPFELLGAEHYNYYFHDSFCCSAPIHDDKNNIIGALNIFSDLDNYFTGALGLVSCLASIFDNRTLIQSALEELDIYELALNDIINHSSRGVVHVDNNAKIKFYNNTLIKLLNFSPSQNDNKIISDFLNTTNCLQNEEMLNGSEVVIPLNGRKKSLFITVHNIITTHNAIKGKLVFVDDTDSVYKSMLKIRGNNAIYTFDDIIGNNIKLIEAKELAKKVAPSRAAVLIHGESGTGKELFAQAIHNASPRKNHPFVSINCGAIPPELIESELFGYEAGAFTGALKGGKPGKLELASSGTLFLDEIESMPLNAQIKLLRALSAKNISRIGSIEEVPIDVRIISATKTDLLKESDEGNFREDLYYRIGTIIIKLPPLRDRIDDIPQLAHHLLKVHSRDSLQAYNVCPQFLKALSALLWRGNIRELSNVIERAIVLSDPDNVLTTDLLPEHDDIDINQSNTEINCKEELVMVQTIADLVEKEVYHGDGKDILKISEEIAIKLALKLESGNIPKAAKRLGISKPTLYSKIKQNANLKT